MTLAEVPDRPYATSDKTIGRCYAFRSLKGLTEFFGLAEIKVGSFQGVFDDEEAASGCLVTFRI